MNLYSFPIVAQATAPANYSKAGSFLFPFLGVLAVLCVLLSARFRKAGIAVFGRPFGERTVIAKSGKQFLLFPEGDPPDPDDGDDPGGPDGGDEPPPSSGGASPAEQAWQPMSRPQQQKPRDVGGQGQARGH